MKNQNSGKIIEAQANKINWVCVLNEGPESCQGGIGFLDGELVHWKGIAVTITLKQSLAIYIAMNNHSKEQLVSNTWCDSGLVKWLNLLSSNLKD